MCHSLVFGRRASRCTLLHGLRASAFLLTGTRTRIMHPCPTLCLGLFFRSDFPSLPVGLVLRRDAETANGLTQQVRDVSSDIHVVCMCRAGNTVMCCSYAYECFSSKTQIS